MKMAIMVASDAGVRVAERIRQEWGQGEVEVFSVEEREGCVRVDSLLRFTQAHFNEYEVFVFVGAMGICVRAIAPCLKSKYVDPAVVNVDAEGRHVISVLSGHVGGANRLTQRIAGILGAEAVVTTQSDTSGLWALDLLGGEYGWQVERALPMNDLIAKFVNARPTALLLEIRDGGTDYLERTRPAHVDVFYHFEDIPQERYELLIAVTPFVHESEVPALYYRPAVLHLGVGCRKQCQPEGIGEVICSTLKEKGLSPLSVGTVATIDLKKDEPLVADLAGHFRAALRIYTSEELKDVEVPHPSEKVFEVTGTYGVAEPELISLRGKRLLEKADLILYAGSLVPVELTYYAKPGATVRSSASMTLEEQFALMKDFYDRGMLIVRLHTGDPCIYGAIQEQMAFFDRYGMRYRITPGISSFLAAAAALRSQFTIPEKVQTIILTRGEGRTPMPEKEKLHLLARSQSTMCIFLSASIVEEVQRELLECYPPETPVAACYHLTWKDEKIYRGELRDLAAIVKGNKLTLTTMIVVGEAIGNREGLSRLYSGQFTHLFRKGNPD